MSDCCYCSGASGLEPTFRLMQAWENQGPKQSSRKGGSDLILREPDPSGRWCCWSCLQKLRDGISPKQGALL